MCLRPSQSVEPERRTPPAHFGHQWHWEGGPPARRAGLNQHRNSMDPLLKIKFHPDDSQQSPLERKMLGVLASLFECSFLFVATFSALFSIVQPKVKNGLVLLAVPLIALIPAAVAGTKAQNGEEKAAESGSTF